MTTANATAFKLPDLDTVYHCEELGPMTLGQMLDGVDPDLVPSDQTMYEDLLWAFGAWDTLEQMNAAMATRVYVADPDGMVGFRLQGEAPHLLMKAIHGFDQREMLIRFALTGSEGNIDLTAGKDIVLLGDIDAKHDIIADITNAGVFGGVGRGMKAGHDVNISGGKAVVYVGTIEAGNDINVQVKNNDISEEDSGITIGALADGEASPIETSFKAGHDALFNVNGYGSILMLGSIGAETGAVKLDISDKGNIFIGRIDVPIGTPNAKTIMAKKDVSLKTNDGNIAILRVINSEDESVLVETAKGDISVGIANVQEDETIKAKKNVSLGTELGTVYILGKTITQDGDISMKAGKETYEEGKNNGNFIIQDDGKLISGGGVGLYGRNGDIYITDDIEAKKSITAQIIDKGSVIFDKDVNVTNNVDISTEDGTIYVGHTVNAAEGTVNLKAETGDILVGKDITAGKNVDISSQQGHILVGDESLGDAGNVLAKSGNVAIQTGQGDVDILKTVTAQEGSINVSSDKGDILIGNNGPDVKTVTAKKAIDLTSKDGRIVVYGKTSTEVGDISLSAHRQEYASGKDNSSFVIDQNGKLEAGRSIHLDVEGGDLHVSDRIQAKEDLAAELQGVGSLYFDTDVDVTGTLKVKTDEGDINIGNDVLATKDISMTANKGDIYVGATVSSGEGNVALASTQGSIDVGGNVTAKQAVELSTDIGDITVGEEVRAGESVNVKTSQGDVLIAKAVTAEQGNIGVNVGTGNVIIGDNGPDVETVTAQESINIGVDVGQVRIYGKTSTKNGDISMAAGANQYTPGGQNFIIEQNGLLASGRDINLTGRNGDLHVTDAIQANRNMNVKVNEEGGVFFDKTASLTGDVKVNTDAGPISIAGQVDANLVELSTGVGDITVGGDIVSDTTVDITTDTGDITLQNVTANGDVNVSGEIGDVSTKNIVSQHNVTMAVGQGNIQTDDITAGIDANVTVKNGDIQMHDVIATENASVFNTENGSINGNNIISEGTTHVKLNNGDLFLNLAEGKAVLLQMENNTEASNVNKVLADASGGTAPDVELTGNYIQIGTLAAKSGNDVFQVSAMGAGNQKLIEGNFYVGSLSAGQGTWMPNLWANRGYIHVDEGDLTQDDVLAVDKIHVDNALTDVSIYGRTPTRDGEQLVYWNNLDMAYSKTRSFQLYTDGTLRTHGANLVDAERNYSKLYGDNLSVVDMMRERETKRHGWYTFDSTLLTTPGQILRSKAFFDMEPVQISIQQKNAADTEIEVGQEEM